VKVEVLRLAFEGEVLVAEVLVVTTPCLRDIWHCAVKVAVHYVDIRSLEGAGRVTADAHLKDRVDLLA
jgi:hypothetical protein